MAESRTSGKANGGDDDGSKSLALDVICYDKLIGNDTETTAKLRRALLEKGIVGVKNIPDYDEKVTRYFSALKEFMSLPEETKARYSPDDSSLNFLGFEKGKEQFLLRRKKKNEATGGNGAEEKEEKSEPDDDWVVDDLKNSFYVHIPDTEHNKWPKETNLKYPSIELGECMSRMGTIILESMGVVFDHDVTIGSSGSEKKSSSSSKYDDIPTNSNDSKKKRIDITSVPRVGRMLYYSKLKDTQDANPYWCGEHFDHGLFTALIPAKYYDVSGGDGVAAASIEIEEPFEAGLHVRCPEDVRDGCDASGGSFQKVVLPPASTVDSSKMIMMFQVGEFGQLYTDDVLLATEHRVSKPTRSNVERYTMALFFDVPKDTFVRSKSALTSDSRYHGGGGDGEAGEAATGCTYEQWVKRSLERYSVPHKNNL